MANTSYVKAQCAGAASASRKKCTRAAYALQSKYVKRAQVNQWNQVKLYFFFF